VIVENRADRRKAAQVVFVGREIAVPGDDVERRAGDLGRMQPAAPFDDQPGGRVAVLVGGDRSEEISGIGETIGADRPALRQREGAAVVLAHIAARRAVNQFGAQLDAARDHRRLAGLNNNEAELRA